MTDEKTPADEAPKTEKATDELAEAAKHLKHAAQIFFDKTSKDPSLKAAAAEAERVIEKVGGAAEPLARQLAGELGKLGRAIAQNLEGTPKKTEAKPAHPAPPETPTDDDDKR